MRHYVFDWGNTIMRDNPGRSEPMHLWPHVELMPDADIVLERLSVAFSVSLATSAAVSDEAMIRRALTRVGADRFFGRIFTTRTIGKRKNEPEFWLRVLEQLQAKPDEVTMVGDNFESDILAPASLGIQSFWLNSHTAEMRSGQSYSTIRRLADLLESDRKPNQSPEPTVTSITPTVGAPVAPAARQEARQP